MTQEQTIERIEKCFLEIERGIKEGNKEECSRCPIQEQCQEYARSGKIS